MIKLTEDEKRNCKLILAKWQARFEGWRLTLEQAIRLERRFP